MPREPAYTLGFLIAVLTPRHEGAVYLHLTWFGHSLSRHLPFSGHFLSLQPMQVHVTLSTIVPYGNSRLWDFIRFRMKRALDPKYTALTE